MRIEDFKSASAVVGVGTLLWGLTGCGPNYAKIRQEGQKALQEHRYAVASGQFRHAQEMWPEDPENLYDLGCVHSFYANRRMAEGNEMAAVREADRAIWCFSRAVEAYPGLQKAVEAKSDALELKGRAEDALRSAEWAMTYVNSSVNQQLYVAKELEERGDADGALLRYRQAVAIEPKNPKAHAEFGRFLYRAGQQDYALAELARAYELNPVEPGVAHLLTQIGRPVVRTAEVRQP